MRFVQLGSIKENYTNITAKIVLISLMFILTFCLSACTSSKAIRTPVADSPSVEQARINQVTDKPVRWGGIIVSVENNADHTLIEVVERPLTRFGTPKVTNKSSGRFFARSKQFIDPENIKVKQAITISGTLIDYSKRMIGEHEYLYPVVEISEYKIWPQNRRINHRPYYQPYWYDPYWGPHAYWYHGHYFRNRHRHW